MSRQLHLNVNILGAGKHPASWRAAEDPLGFLTLDHYVRIARIAEDAAFDAVFLSDGLALAADPPVEPWQVFDPPLLLSALAAATSRIGLIGTISTSFAEPFDVARKVATLDHLSKGRAGWNIVTSNGDRMAANFGAGPIASHAARYQRADEFVAVVRKLWDSWQDGALVGDARSGVLVDGAKLAPIDHRGAHFSVAGPGIVPRPPQGHPVLVQAGSSADGKALASKYADIVFTAQTVFDDARAFAAEIKRSAAGLGRDPASVRILPGFFPIVGATEEDAARRKRQLDELIDFDRERNRLGLQLGIDPSDLRLDEQLPYHLRPDPQALAAPHGFADGVWALGSAEKLTVRQILLRNGGFHRLLVGTPERIADDMERWFAHGAADGFNLNFDVFPSGLEDFVDAVVPLLRQRGLFRREYSGITLKNHLGITRS